MTKYHIGLLLILSLLTKLCEGRRGSTAFVEQIPLRRLTAPVSQEIISRIPVTFIKPSRRLFLYPTSQQTKQEEGTIESPSAPLSIHPWAIQAIAEALPTLTKTMILNDDQEEDPYEVMSYIGSVTQRTVHRARLQDPEESQVLGGRVVALLTRLELLEDQLQAHAKTLLEGSNHIYSPEKIEEYLGLPAIELVHEPTDSPKIIRRAETLLAWFLETIEGPGLRANNIVVPCMEVDFLDDDRYQALIAGREDKIHKKNMEVLQATLNELTVDEAEPRKEETTSQRSLHPLTVDILIDVLRLRSQNDTEAPMRFINDSIEGWEILAQATKLAERVVQPALRQGGLNQEEASLIGGRVVAIVMRLEDLEWELVHRCQKEAWIKEQDLWYSFGVLPDESCIRTLDERILQDSTFTKCRAERLLAIFLLNLEGPGVKAAGDRLLDGSIVDFLDDDHYELMMPRKK